MAVGKGSKRRRALLAAAVLCWTLAVLGLSRPAAPFAGLTMEDVTQIEIPSGSRATTALDRAYAQEVLDVLVQIHFCGRSDVPTAPACEPRMFYLRRVDGSTITVGNNTEAIIVVNGKGYWVTTDSQSHMLRLIHLFAQHPDVYMLP